MGKEKEKDVRGKWNNQLEYMMSCLGFSVGVGSLWRFPYVVLRNGGGAFLIVSVIFLLVCGIPVLFMETSLGQYNSLSPLKCWSILPLFKGIGISMVLLSTIFSIYYTTVIIWTLYYTVMSFQSTLPWTTCGNAWNTETCVPIISTNSSNNQSRSFVVENATTKDGLLSTEEFWTYNVLDLSPGFEYMGTPKWQLALCGGGAWLVVFICLCKGVFSSRKAVYITAPLPFVLLTILLVRGAMLPGSLDGVLFFLTPDWSRLLVPQVWIEGMMYGFYGLGNGYGAIITLGSYNEFHHNALRSSVAISLADLLSCVYCGFTLFTALGYMAHEAGVTVEELRNSGPGLIFITYPQIAAMLPIPQLWSAIFFLTCFTLGIDSQRAFPFGTSFGGFSSTLDGFDYPRTGSVFGTFKTLTSGLCDSFPRTLGKHKVLVCLTACVCGYLIGLIYITQGGMYYFQVVDWYSGALAVTSIVLFEAIAMSWMYDVHIFGGHIQQMMPRLSNRTITCLKYYWKFILPVICLTILAISLAQFKPPTLNDYKYPTEAIALGWTIAVFVVLPIPGAMVYGMIKTRGSLKERFRDLITPRHSPKRRHYCEKCPDAIPAGENNEITKVQLLNM